VNKSVTGIVLWNVAKEAVNRIAQKLTMGADAGRGAHL